MIRTRFVNGSETIAARTICPVRRKPSTSNALRRPSIPMIQNGKSRNSRIDSDRKRKNWLGTGERRDPKKIPAHLYASTYRICEAMKRSRRSSRSFPSISRHNLNPYENRHSRAGLLFTSIPRGRRFRSNEKSSVFESLRWILWKVCYNKLRIFFSGTRNRSFIDGKVVKLSSWRSHSGSFDPNRRCGSILKFGSMDRLPIGYRAGW